MASHAPHHACSFPAPAPRHRPHRLDPVQRHVGAIVRARGRGLAREAGSESAAASPGRSSACHAATATTGPQRHLRQPRARPRGPASPANHTSSGSRAHHTGRTPGASRCDRSTPLRPLAGLRGSVRPRPPRDTRRCRCPRAGVHPRGLVPRLAQQRGGCGRDRKPCADLAPSSSHGCERMAGRSTRKHADQGQHGQQVPIPGLEGDDDVNHEGSHHEPADEPRKRALVSHGRRARTVAAVVGLNMVSGATEESRVSPRLSVLSGRKSHGGRRD